MLNKHWLADTSNLLASSCLAEAMACWFVDNVYRSITSYAFEACNANPCSSCPSVFFPLPEDPYHAWTPWRLFCVKPGYLWQFNQLMKGCDEQRHFEINDRLGEIFSNLQCLSISVGTSKKVIEKPWVINKQGKMQFITNSMFYKILGLSESGAPVQYGQGHRPSSLQRSSPWTCTTMLAMMSWLPIEAFTWSGTGCGQPGNKGL